MKKPGNPFITTGYYGPEYFCDRKKETIHLIDNLNNDVNSTITSIRRIGKTGLIKHLFYQLPREWKSIYVDILATENLSQFLNVLATSILNAIPEKERVGGKIRNFIKSLRPVFSYDPLTNNPQLSFNLENREVEMNIQSIFKFLETQNFKIVIAIDEFQQIINYPEKHTEAWLRTVIQEVNNVRFIFSGSQQHIMNELFTSPSKPFYRSTSMLNLEKIAIEKYSVFIIQKFNEFKKQISEEVVAEMMDWTNNHTYYVQLLCNKVFANKQAKIVSDVWKEEAVKLLNEEELFFLNYRNLLTIPQWQLLKAIAAEGSVKAPTSIEFIAKYRLGNPSTVLRSLNSLLDREMLYKSYSGIDGKLFYSVYDILFQRWAETK